MKFFASWLFLCLATGAGISLAAGLPANPWIADNIEHTATTSDSQIQEHHFDNQNSPVIKQSEPTVDFNNIMQNLQERTADLNQQRLEAQNKAERTAETINTVNSLLAKFNTDSTENNKQNDNSSFSDLLSNLSQNTDSSYKAKEFKNKTNDALKQYDSYKKNTTSKYNTFKRKVKSLYNTVKQTFNNVEKTAEKSTRDLQRMMK